MDDIDQEALAKIFCEEYLEWGREPIKSARHGAQTAITTLAQRLGVYDEMWALILGEKGAETPKKPERY
jgi:hypothetical protein